MGNRANARAALVDWLRAAEIVDYVHPTWPRIFQWDNWGAGLHRCQLIVFIEEEGELRISIGGPTSGKKRIDYLVSLEIFHRSTDTEPINAMDDFDRLVDEIKDRLRADRRAGQTDDAVVWQLGEGGYGIQLDFWPVDALVGGKPIETRGRMRFEITQWITS